MENSRIILIGVVAIIILIGIAVVSIFGSNISGAFLGIFKPSTVAVTGYVETVGTGTYPQKITFISHKTGNKYVSTMLNRARYKVDYMINLKNLDTYKVKITWAVAGITVNECDAGTLNLDSFQSTIYRNWAC